MPARVRMGRALLLGVVAVLLIALFRWNPRLPSGADAPLPPDLDDQSDAPKPRPPRQPPAAGASAPVSCEPRASQACRAGDVWWFDGCGSPEELAESCQGRACTDGRCAPAAQRDPRCVQVSSYGVCEGDRAVACIDDKILSIDCAAKGQRCVTTREGAQCLPRDPKNGCGERDLASCVGDRLRECVDGTWTEIDCAARRASCIADGDGARCGASAASAPLPALEPKTELCNGHDDDADGRVDEADACRPIPLVAFVPESAQLSELSQRMAADLEIVNQSFSPLQFAWAKQVTVSSELRVLDPSQLGAVARVLSQQESSVVQRRARGGLEAAAGEDAGLPFYIPVLFSERLRAEPPKSGISTLPNATCGRVRISDTPSPPYGLIVLSDRRTPQTLSHELGHYLGLCHTHEELDKIAAAASDVPACQRSGDGICDTATDFGPNACAESGPCDFYCPASSARPDGSNLMSYYMHCRHVFTPEQLSETTRGLELRRGWFSCLDPQDCPCEPGSNACPAEMSCHPRGGAASPWACELDGPSWPGTSCQGSSQCAFGSICLTGDTHVGGRCVRPCARSEDCECVDVGLPFRICGQDFG